MNAQNESPHTTLRLLMFEVYEQGSDFPLFVTSDAREARDAMSSGDRMTMCYWLREGTEVVR